MNNQQVNLDQMTQLQNIAYIKQFMRKGSIKVMMVVSFIQAILVLVFSFMSSSFINAVNDFIMDYGDFSSILEGNYADVLTNLGDIFLFIGLFYSALGLIFPITLLIIVLKAHNDEPTAISRGGVQFLRVLAIIQFVFQIISGVISLGVSVASLSSNNSSVRSIVSSLISVFISCLYYYYQVKFLSSVRTACDGQTLSSEGAQGLAIYAVIFSIIFGITIVGLLVIMVLLSSFASSTQIGADNIFESITPQILKLMNTFLIIIMIIVALNLIYNIALALTAFGYRDTVMSVVRESYAAAQNTRTSNARMFKTYGGGSMYNNYNYSNTGSGVEENNQQQAYQTATAQQSSNNNLNTQTATQTVSAHTNVNLNKETDSISNPYNSNNSSYNNSGNNSFNSDLYNNSGNGSFNSDPYNNSGNGSFNSDPYNNSGNGSFNPDPYNNSDNGSFNSNLYNNSSNGSFNSDLYNNANSQYNNQNDNHFTSNGSF